ncbi:hypothetical protein GMDG_00479 [Pseudogymnoascus destructans 20631-21]|uniref:Uncharacterized protein n=1 Tax=Pseudogymnoascus destructans (strain ATCC MYA-4855 / 20631-21) TaxID=658429 RepID=L8G5A7_PSED2|nr:hypothetical protein GMDG_00479 [Pseudogymnoascus destructans 20631-21]
MTSTRPDGPLRRADQPFFAARKREPKYFALDTAAASTATGAPSAPTTTTTTMTTNTNLAGASNTHARAQSYAEPATTLRGAWERAALEDGVVEGSPSPAARRRSGPTAIPRAVTNTAEQGRRDRDKDGRSLDLWRRSAGSPAVGGGSTTGSESGSLTGTDEGDEFDRKMGRFARDEERVRKLVGGDGIFGRRGASGRGGVTGTVEEKEPGVRIPAQWGRRARKSDKWMQRIVSPESSGEVDAPLKKEGRDTINWAEPAADTPLTTVEGEAGQQQLTPPRSRHASVQPEKSAVWDAELDFTATSLMGGESPQLRIRNTKLDEVRARETEAMSRHAVATARLEEIRERLSEERSISPQVEKAAVREPTRIPSPVVRNPAYRWTSTESFEIVESGKSLEAGPATERLFGEIKGAKTEPKEIQRGRRSRSRERPAVSRASPSRATLDDPDQFHEKTILEEEGEQIPGTPIIIFRNTERPQDGHKREDSYDTLRRLAAISSPNPSPIPLKSEENQPPEDTRRRRPVSQAPEEKRHSRSSSLTKSDIDPEERIAAEKDLFEIPDSKSERNSMREPSPGDEDELPEQETPRPKQKQNPLTMATPVVTGAFIETPAPTVRHSRIRPPSPALERVNPKPNSKSDTKPSQPTQPQSKAPSRPRRSSSTSSRSPSRSRNPSASEPSAQNPQIERLKPAPRAPRPRLTNSAPPPSAAADLLRIQHEAAIEDSTLDDLADLLSSSPPPAEPPIPVPDRDDKGRPLSASARERRLSEQQLVKMERGLSHGLESIRDAKRGIEKLEQVVSSAPPVVAKDVAAVPGGAAVCAHCASQSSVYHLMIPLPRLWFRDRSRMLGVRLTWFGLLVLVGMMVYIAECLAYAWIGKPEFASGWDYDINGPAFGWSLLRLGERAGGWMWGVWTEGMGEEVRGGRGGGGVGGGGGGKVRGMWEDGSMLEDEML